ncbi:hypothetical protein [Pseudocitrobacter vendiensis]|uniref:Uncharacterized protein n=1 Tax=Pseudocitrobacter vendiensis TaxID=2488306 RepID=A0ABN8TIW5_9ENTR|nr:hypothetical protein [Pseudocitrobacter vendiensis]CAH6661652.1 hypothetical protein FBBNIHIM_21295 [Pseudocitrobacter vendiensis]
MRFELPISCCTNDLKAGNIPGLKAPDAQAYRAYGLFPFINIAHPCRPDKAFTPHPARTTRTLSTI